MSEYEEASRVTDVSQLPATPTNNPSYDRVLFLWLDNLHESLTKKELKKVGKRLNCFINLEVWLYVRSSSWPWPCPLVHMRVSLNRRCLICLHVHSPGAPHS